MDRERDGKRFRALMNRFSAVYRNGYDASDDMSDAFWNALKDVPYSEVLANAERLMATATPASPMPRPASLRNRPAPIERPLDKSAEARSYMTWRELRQHDPVRFEIEFRTARAETALAQLYPDSPDYEDWRREVERWRSLRYAARPEQEAAVAAILGELP